MEIYPASSVPARQTGLKRIARPKYYRWTETGYSDAMPGTKGMDGVFGFALAALVKLAPCVALAPNALM